MWESALSMDGLHTEAILRAFTLQEVSWRKLMNEFFFFFFYAGHADVT